MSDRLDSLFYTYNNILYGEHNDCRFNSIAEVVTDIRNDFYSNLYDEGWEFIKSIKDGNVLIYNAILLETIHRLGLYVNAYGNMDYISNLCEKIEVRYSADFIQSVVDYFLLKYVDILEFNKEYFNL